MKLDIFQNQTLNAMEAYMTRLSQRQQIVSSNLANIDTPGYKTKDTSFHATMQELLADSDVNLQTSRPEHSQGMIQLFPQAQVFEVQGIPSRADENNVDLDREMLKLSETSFAYSLITQMVRSKFGMIATSINEGKA
ncbi:MAG TPA: flagellar basal body rod protein FlgB [Acidobacteriota bacterium]|nr:flagellar basal body rod protein FlgB [Acidobacteriota bacterium]